MSAGKSARLTGSLLSRKGMAAPSATPESRANKVRSRQPAAARRQIMPQDATLADWINSNKQQVRQALAPSKSRGQEGKRIRVSLRLDEDRHMRLKLVAAHTERSLQSLFTEALDEYFDRHAPELADAFALLRRGKGTKTRKR